MTGTKSKQEVQQALNEVVNRMLGRGAPVVWDGQGFSKMDWPFASSLADQFASRGKWSDKQTAAIQKTLRKYAKQLSTMSGIDTETAFAEFEADPIPAPQEMSAVLTGTRVFLNTHGYRPDLNENIKRVSGRRFHPASGSSVACWSFPQESIEQAAELFPTNTDIQALNKQLAGKVFAPKAVAPVGDVLALEQVVRAEVPGLFEHQVTGIAHLLAYDRFLLGDDMGLGKTRQAVVAAVRHGGAVLVVCPATLKKNWLKEIKAVDPAATVHILKGSSGIDQSATWNIVNYDILGRNRDSLRSRNYTTLILDEAHYIKNDSQRSDEILGHKANANAKSSRKQQELVGLADAADRVVLLTGTPLMSRPKDLFNLLKAIKHPLSRNFMAYAKRYCDARHNGFGWDFSGASNLGELGERISDRFLQRKKDQCLDLPEKVRMYQDIDLNGGAEEYEALEAELEEQYEAGETIRIAVLGALKQKTAQLALAATIERVESILEGTEKVLVFTNYTAPIDEMAAHFGSAAVVIDGRTPNEKRLDIADRFNSDPTVRVLIGNIKAAGVGLNLTAATQVVINDMDWVPANHAQAEDRCYRIGQRNAVTCAYMVPVGTLAEWLRDLNEGKAEIVGTVEQSAMAWLLKRRAEKEAA